MKTKTFTSFAIISSLLIMSTFAGKTILNQVQESSQTALDEIEESVFGETYGKRQRSPAPDYVNILISDKELNLDSSAKLFYMIGQIDFDYNINMGMPFSPLAHKFRDYMQVVKKVLDEHLPNDKLSAHAIKLMHTFKAVLKNAQPTTITKENGDYLAYNVDWEVMDAFSRAVGDLWGSKLILKFDIENQVLEDSFNELDALYDQLSYLEKDYKNKFTEITEFNLAYTDFKDDFEAKLNPIDVIETIRTLLNVFYNYLSSKDGIESASFYPEFKKSCKNLMILIEATEDACLVSEAKSFVKTFNKLTELVKMNYYSNGSALRVFIFEHDSKDAFQTQTRKLKVFIDSQDPDETFLKDLIGMLSSSLESVQNSLKSSVLQSLDNTYKDYILKGNEFARIIKNQQISQQNWNNMRSLHRELNNKQSIFKQNSSSEIAADLYNFFQSVLNIVESYEQLPKFHETLFYLYQVAIEFIQKSVPEQKTTPQLNVIAYYKYPRLPCFSLQQHLSEFVGFFEEQVKINFKDSLIQQNFLSVLRNADGILNNFGRRITYTRGHCFEIFHGLNEQGAGLEISNDFLEGKGFTDEVENPLDENKNARVEDSSPLSTVGFPIVDKTSNDKVPEGMKVQLEEPMPLLSRNNSQNEREKIDNVLELPEQIIDESQDISPNINEETLELPAKIIEDEINNSVGLNTDTVDIISSTVQGDKKPLKKIRRVFFIEFLDCPECLNDDPLKKFVQSIINPISHI